MTSLIIEIKSFIKRKINQFKIRLKICIWSNNLTALAILYGTDKAGQHNYSKLYGKYFAQIKNKRLNILEIGIGGYNDPESGGESLMMWKTYFKKSNIFGVDIYDKSKNNQNRIKTFIGDQTDKYFLTKVVNEIGTIDIIIDDGSHINHHVIETFKILFPSLKSEGIYVIEDLQTSYWEKCRGIEWGGSNDLNSNHTSMNFLKSLVDGLNYEEYQIKDYQRTYFDKHIISIHFYHNIAFIFKGLNDEGSNIIKKRLYSE